jgi:recombination protein RecA
MSLALVSPEFLEHQLAKQRGALDSLHGLRAFEVPSTQPTSRPCGFATLEELLPDRGYPQGVVELCAPHRLGGATSLALGAIAALHAADPEAHAAWIDPDGALYAPGVLAAGVDLARLFVVRPPWERMTETAVKVASSSAFPLVVVDVDPQGPHAGRRPLGSRGELFVRKMQLAAESAQGTVLMLTDAHAGRSSLPVTMRLRLERRKHAVSVRIDKDRHGRVGNHTLLPLAELHAG